MISARWQTLPAILLSLCVGLLHVGAAHAGKVFKHIDKDGKVYYTDMPDSAEQAREKSNAATLERINATRRDAGQAPISWQQRQFASDRHNATKLEVSALEARRDKTCGQPPQGAILVDEAAEQYKVWEKCHDEFEEEIKVRKMEMRAAEREFLLVK